MNHVVRVFRDPHLGFPCNVRQERLHRAAGFKGSDKNQTRFAAREQLFEFLATLSVHRPRTGDGFNKQQPILCGVMNDDIGYLCGGAQSDSKRGKDNSFDERTCSPCRQCR